MPESPLPNLPPQAAVDPVQTLLRLSNGLAQIAALRAALEANVADYLLAGPKPIAEIAEIAGFNEDALYRCIRLLATEQIFTEVAPHIFDNTPASAMMVTSHPLRLRDNLLWGTSKFSFRTFTGFMHSVRTGEPCIEKVFGMPAFEYLPTDPESNTEFNNAMTAISAMVVPSVLDSYDFSGIGTLCDVAGGHGFLLTSILEKHPDVTGILFDLDHVIQGAKPRIEQMGLASRCTTIAGNFFEAVPAANSYIMKHIIHDWEESKAITILANCAKSLSGSGRILLVESLIKGPDVPDFGKTLDIFMLTMPGGKERTEEEYGELLAKASLRINRIVPNRSPLWLIEAVRA
jgi:hypothetical protein